MEAASSPSAGVLSRGSSLHAQGRYREEAQLYRSALAAAGGFSNAAAEEAEIAFRLGRMLRKGFGGVRRFGDARALADKACALAPDEPRYAYLRARVLLDLAGQQAQAEGIDLLRQLAGRLPQAARRLALVHGNAQSRRKQLEELALKGDDKAFLLLLDMLRSSGCIYETDIMPLVYAGDSSLRRALPERVVPTFSPLGPLDAALHRLGAHLGRRQQTWREWLGLGRLQIRRVLPLRPAELALLDALVAEHFGPAEFLKGALAERDGRLLDAAPLYRAAIEHGVTDNHWLHTYECNLERKALLLAAHASLSAASGQRTPLHRADPGRPAPFPSDLLPLLFEHIEDFATLLALRLVCRRFRETAFYAPVTVAPVRVDRQRADMNRQARLCEAWSLLFPRLCCLYIDLHKTSGDQEHWSPLLRLTNLQRLSNAVAIRTNSYSALTSLRALSCRVDGHDEVYPLVTLSRLEDLTLQCNDALIAQLTRLKPLHASVTRLEALADVPDQPHISPLEAEVISRFFSLRCLELRGFAVDTLAFLPSLPSLRRLALHSRALPPDELAFLAQLPHLAVLTLSGCWRLTDTHLSQHLPASLVSLHVMHCDAVSGLGLARLTRLRCLSVSSVQSPSLLRALTRLESLSLAAVRDAAVPSFKSFPRLLRLRFGSQPPPTTGTSRQPSAGVRPAPAPFAAVNQLCRTPANLPPCLRQFVPVGASPDAIAALQQQRPELLILDQY